MTIATDPETGRSVPVEVNVVGEEDEFFEKVAGSIPDRAEDPVASSLMGSAALVAPPVSGQRAIRSLGLIRRPYKGVLPGGEREASASSRDRARRLARLESLRQHRHAKRVLLVQATRPSRGSISECTSSIFVTIDDTNIETFLVSSESSDIGDDCAEFPDASVLEASSGSDQRVDSGDQKDVAGSPRTPVVQRQTRWPISSFTPYPVNRGGRGGNPLQSKVGEWNRSVVVTGCRHGDKSLPRAEGWGFGCCRADRE